MPNATSNSRFPGRSHLHTRLHAFFAASDQDRSGATSGASSSSSSSTTPSPRPLAPSNTFAERRHDSIVAGNFAVAQELALEMSFAEMLESRLLSCDDHLERVEPVDDYSDSDGDDDLDNRSEATTVEDKDDDDQDALFACKSAPSPYLSMEEEHILSVPASGTRGARSSSVPSRPLKSALVRSSSPSKRSDTRVKRAHFTESAIQSRESLHRSKTDPGLLPRVTSVERNFTQQRFAHDLSMSEISPPEELDAGRIYEDQELAAAINVFEEVVEELVQVAEEHAEAHQQLVAVAREVAKIITEDRAMELQEDDTADIDNDDDAQGSTVSELDAASDRCAYAPSSRRISSEDDDIQKSYVFNQSFESLHHYNDEQDDEEELFIDLRRNSRASSAKVEDSKSRKVESESITEVRRTSCTETVWALSSRGSDQVPIRRVSHHQEGSAIEMDHQDVRRRLSMGDIGKSAAQLKLLPFSAKAEPASCAVTVCSVRAVEPTILTVYEHQDPQRKRRECSSAPQKTAQTVRSDSGTFQVL